MKTKFQSGQIKLLVKKYPVLSIEIYNRDDLWFGTNNPSVLLDISKVIAQLAKELNEESKKEMVAHNKNLKKDGK